MRRPYVVLLLVLVIATGACSKQAPEVSVNDQVPAGQRVAEAPAGEEDAAAGGGGEGVADADGLWTAGAGLAYDSAPDSIPADGALLALELTAGTPHNVVIEGFEGDRILVEGSGPGVDSAEVAISAGSYTYYCSIAGHRAAGMEGQVAVE